MTRACARSTHRSQPSHESVHAPRESALRPFLPARSLAGQVLARSAPRAPDPASMCQDATGSGRSVRRTATRRLSSNPSALRSGHARANFAYQGRCPTYERRHPASRRPRPAGPAAAPWRFAAPGDGWRAAPQVASRDGETRSPIPAAGVARPATARPPAARRSSAMSRGIGRPSGAL